MNINEIDAVSYAANIAHLAAGRFFALLSDEGETMIYDNWFYLGGILPPRGEIDTTIDEFADYVTSRSVTNPEQLYLHAKFMNLVETEAERFRDEELVIRESYRLFVETCRTVHGTIANEQKRIEGAATRAREKVPPLRIEDSIFEPVGSMNELTGPLEEEQRRRASTRRAARQTGQSETPKAQPKTRKTPAKPKAMSAGTPPARQPVNRGGRGRKKQQ